MNVERMDNVMSTKTGRQRGRWSGTALVAGLSVVACASAVARADTVVEGLQPTITMTSESTLNEPIKKAAAREASTRAAPTRGTTQVSTPPPPRDAATAALTGAGSQRSPRPAKVLPGMRYGGHANGATEFQGVGVTRKTGSRYALHFPGQSKLNGPLMGVFKDSEERFNACYFGAVDGGLAPDAVTTANFRFTIASGTMRVAKLELAPGSKVAKPLAACLGRALRKLVLPVSKDVAGTFSIEFAHSYESRQVASAR